METMPDPALLTAAIEQLRALCNATVFIRDKATGAALLGPAADGSRRAPPPVIHSEDRARYAAAAETDGPYRVAYRLADGAGGWRDVEEAGRTVRLDGRAYRVGAAVDVSERHEFEPAPSRCQSGGREIAEQRQMELALRASEAELRAIVDTQTEWVTKQTPAGHYIFVNQAYCRYMAMTREQLLDPTYDDLAPLSPEDRARYLAARAALAPAHPTFTIEVTARHPDGSAHIEEWTETGIFDEVGRAVSCQSVGRDVTAQRRAEAALRESEQELRAIVDTQTEWVTTQDLASRLTFVNQAYCRYMAMTREQLLDPTYDDLAPLSPKDRARYLAARAALTPADPTFTIEVTARLPDGSAHIEEWTETGIFDEAGRAVYWQSVGRDVTAQRRTEAALRASEQELRAIVDTRTEWVTRQDVAGRLPFVNQAYCRYMGMTHEELLDPTYDDLAQFSREDRARYLAARAALTPADPTFTIELTARHRDGSTRIEEWTETGIFDEAGRAVSWQSVGREVTAQRRAEAALRASEQELRAIVDTQTEWVIRQDLAARLTFVNQAYCRYMGMTREQLLDPTYDGLALVSPEDRARLAAGRAALTPADPTFTIELTVRHPGGSARIEEWTGTGIFDDTGRAVSYQAVGRDVTAQRRAEAALRETEQRFRRFAEAHPVPLCAQRAADGRVLFANPAYLALFQLAWEELDAADKRSHWADSGQRAPYYERLLREGRTVDCEVVLRRKDGTTFPALLSSRLMEFGGAQAVVDSVVDLTRQRAAEAEIQRQREALHQSEKLAALGSLLAGVAHELNNPLSVVVGYASLLRSEARGKKTREQAEHIHAAAERCARIVKSFLGMARQKPPRFGPVDLATTVAAALELTGYALRTSGIRVRTKLPAGLPPVHGDADQIHQVVANLVINAKQALQERQGPRRIEIRAAAAGKRVRLTVADNGPGMPPEVVRRVFEPFFTTKPVGLGTGLGLAVCHGIVAAHGGRIDVHSDVGRGTRVEMLLPVVAAAVPPADSDKVERKARRGGRILVVEDEAEIAGLIAGALTAAGHRVEQAPDGEAALKRIERGGIDLVISDLRMPGKDGASEGASPVGSGARAVGARPDRRRSQRRRALRAAAGTGHAGRKAGGSGGAVPPGRGAAGGGRTMSAAGEGARRHVLVVDDEPALRALLVDFLGRRGLEVTEAADGAGMWDCLAAGPVDLIVLDVTMPEQSGLDLLLELRARGDDVPVVMLTGLDGLGDRLTGLGRGADDYVTKPFEPRELLARIRAVLRRAPARPRRPAPNPVEKPRLYCLGRCLFDPANGRLTSAQDGTEVLLTGMELDLLRLMLRHPDVPLSRERIEEFAHGIPGGSGGRGVDARIRRLRQKLEPDPSRPRVLRTLRGEGYVLATGEGVDGPATAAATTSRDAR